VPLILVLFIAVPILELYVLLKVGSLIGVGPTLAIIIGSALLGSLLLRHEGRGAWRRFNQALAEHRFPGNEVADGLAIAIGGALLLTPGFITDAAGLFLLIPPTRATVKRLARGYFTRRFRTVRVTTFRGPGTGPGPGPDPTTGEGPTPGRRSYDFDGTAQEEPAGDDSVPDNELESGR
jgi:UPF0716 protein FxsA